MHRYTYWHSDVLKNKLHIRDYDKLQEAERRLTAVREAELYIHPVQGSFDLEHLRKIHGYLFQDLYTFAGEIRKTDISKHGISFCSRMEIESCMSEWMKGLVRENYLQNISDKDDYVDRFTEYFSRLNYIHPFREGNGRSTRLFMKQLCETYSSYAINYSKIDKEQWIPACDMAMNNDYRALARLFENAINESDDKQIVKNIAGRGLPDIDYLNKSERNKEL